jgi:hypothetical protein
VNLIKERITFIKSSFEKKELVYDLCFNLLSWLSNFINLNNRLNRNKISFVNSHPNIKIINAPKTFGSISAIFEAISSKELNIISDQLVSF